MVKIYESANEYSYDREVEVLERLHEYVRERFIRNGTNKIARGFPQVISILKSPMKNEIILKAQGPNLHTLLKQIPN